MKEKWKPRYIVEVVLYTGQHLHSVETASLRYASEIRDDLVAQTMVEEAYIIDCNTGALVWDGRWPCRVAILRNAATMWRTE